MPIPPGVDPSGADLPPPREPSIADLDLPDLAVPGVAAPKPSADAALPPAELDDDLPAPLRPSASKALAGDADLDLDLPGMPAAKVEADLPAVAPPGEEAALPAMPGDLLSLDLPAVSDQPRAAPANLDLDDLDLPSSTASAPAAPPRPSPGAGGDLDLPDIAGPDAEPEELELPALGAQPRIRPPAAPGGATLGMGSPEPPSDLPSPAGGADLPSPAGGGIDLPSPAGGTDLPSPAGGGADLPSPTGGIDLPSPTGGIDLPSPAGGIDLPSPAVGGVDLPSPGGGVDLPSLGGGIDLPSPGGGIDLPSPGGGGDLPSLGGGIDLPSPGGDLDIPSPGGGAGGTLPGGSFDLPPPPGALSATVPGMPAPSGGPPLAPADLAVGAAAAAATALGGDAFGELDLPSMDDVASAPPAAAPAAADDLLSAPLPSDQPGADLLGPDPTDLAGVERQEGGGGTDYGEVSLDGGLGADEMALDAEGSGGPGLGDDDMEFGGIPQEDEERGIEASGMDISDAAGSMGAAAGGAAAADMAQRRAERAAAPAAEKKKRPTVKILVALGITLGVGGGALALVPSLGPFGVFWIEGLLKGGEFRSLVTTSAEESRARLALDTYPKAQEALQELDRKRTESKRLKSLVAYQAFTSYLTELRYGQDRQVRARAKVLLDELAAEQEVAYLALARAASEVVGGRLPGARKTISAMVRRDPKNVDALALSGEVELIARDAKAAVAAWQAGAKVEDSARMSFGLARAFELADDAKAAEAAAQKALKLSDGHVGARVLLARIEWRARKDEKAAIELLDAAKKSGNASPTETVELHTLLGDIHLGRSRVTQAEAAFGAALKLDPKAGGALRGLGEALYRAGRFTEALARFEAAAQADPDDLRAKVGVAKMLLSLERLQDAQKLLAQLSEAHPKNLVVAYWEGRAYEAVGNREKAEDSYRRSIKHGGDDMAVVDSYVSLAMLLNQKGQEDDARRTLKIARRKLPVSPVIHKALGQLALSQGRNEEALAEFREALKLDPNDLGAKFKLAVALRRNREFEEAQTVFDEVAAVDKDYPGLALERGLLFEESGRTEEALKAYEAALAKAPNDPDLMLRVGCGTVSAGGTERAGELLRKVLAQRPNSSETNHCLGRALLLEGNLAEALKKLERAAALDPHRAEYHMYVGWAANAAGDSGKAQTALKRALELDQNLADAYWQRGVLAIRQGRVRDAVEDLKRALELKPSRAEAHAALAESYDGLGMEAQALGEWRAAIESHPNNARWRFRFGKLLAANRNHEAAQVQLGRALELAEAETPKPRWSWDAHLLLARSLGMRKDAIKHWEAFLRESPLDSPYRPEAQAALNKLGKPWQGR